MEATQILKWLDEVAPDRLPLVEVDRFELGMLVGQQVLINKLKTKLKVEDDKEMRYK